MPDRSCHRHPSAAGFTLIELLVVIAIVALLVGILLPSLHGAQALGRQTREISAARQTMLAYHAYAAEAADAVLPGLLAEADVATNAAFEVRNQHGDVLSSLTARRYPWRLAPFLDGGVNSLIVEPDVTAAIERTYGKGGQSPSQFLVDYNLSIFSTLGLNADLVGGAFSRGGDGFAYKDASTWLRERSRFGVVTRTDQPRRSDRLITFASARVPREWYDPQLGLAEPEGYHRVVAPSLAGARVWAEAYDDHATDTRANAGHLHLRHADKAVVAMFDGHADVLGWDELDDMTRWADRETVATGARGRPRP